MLATGGSRLDLHQQIRDFSGSETDIERKPHHVVRRSPHFDEVAEPEVPETIRHHRVVDDDPVHRAVDLTEIHRQRVPETPRARTRLHMTEK